MIIRSYLFVPELDRPFYELLKLGLVGLHSLKQGKVEHREL